MTEYEAVPAVAQDELRPHDGLVVMKFGGTSVGTPERLRAVAARLAAAREKGRRVVAVLSAMGHTTDELLDLAHAVSPRPHPRELDMLVSVGERVSCALAAMALIDLGHDAVSLTGSQAGIVTDTVHGKAKIVEVRAKRIHEMLDRGRIVLVAGFQGVSTETTTSRPSAEAAPTRRPWPWRRRSAPTPARSTPTSTACLRPTRGSSRTLARSTRISYDEMLELAASGAGVMHCAPSSSHETTELRYTSAPPSPRGKEPGSSRRMRCWRRP